jgi:hypothetical protein
VSNCGFFKYLTICCATVAILVSAACSRPHADPTRNELRFDDAQANSARYDCLIEKGFAVARDEQGGVTFIDPGDALRDEYSQARTECEQELIDAGLMAPLASDDDLRSEYAVLEDLHTCLVNAGFPLLSWPTEDVYVEDVGRYNVLESTAPVEITEARSACPDQYRAVDQLP